jgi:hypothetical protein
LKPFINQAFAKIKGFSTKRFYWIALEKKDIEKVREEGRKREREVKR